tara:strand:+ start:122 stop:589 length:468 start_codon:yes stop_codon:yes gene_type:complete
MTNGDGFVISGADSNICTDNAVGSTWCYSDDAFDITTLKYLINDVLKYTSSVTGSVYVSLTTSAGSPNTGNAWAVTYDSDNKILIITWNTSPEAGDGNCFLGINSDQSIPSPIDGATGCFYVDNVTYTAVRESASNVQALSGTAEADDELQFSLG